MKRNAAVWALVLVLTLVCGWGMGTALADEAVAPAGIAAEAPKLVTATLFDSDLREAIREMALQTGVNIVLDENVRGTVTVELKAVPLEKALRMVLLTGGYSFRKIDDFYVCGLADPKNPLFKDLADTEFVVFQSASAESARALLPTVFLPYVQFDITRNTATIIGPRTLVDTIKAILLQMDAPRAQVRVKVLVTDVSRDVVKQWGLDLLNFDFSKGQTVNTAWQTALSLVPGSVGIVTDIFGQLVAKMKALERESKAKVHADPVLMVTDGKTGELFVGSRHDVPTGAEDTNGNPLQQTVEAGVTLKVTPRIVGKNIQLDMVQKVSDYTDVGGSAAPVLRTAEVTSSLMLAPGQSALAGSLTRATAVTGYSKVPILGNIPLLRLLFRRDSSRLADSELLVFVSAEVVQ